MRKAAGETAGVQVAIPGSERRVRNYVTVGTKRFPPADLPRTPSVIGGNTMSSAERENAHVRVAERHLHRRYLQITGPDLTRGPRLTLLRRHDEQSADSSEDQLRDVMSATG